MMSARGEIPNMIISDMNLPFKVEGGKTSDWTEAQINK